MTREHYQLKRKEERRNVFALAIIAVLTVIGLVAIALVIRSLR
jgi:hypothetical protein